MLSIFDHHTHFLQLVLLPDKKANQVLTVVLDHYIIFFFGPRDYLHTGNGLSFSSDEGWFLLKHSFSVVYHPQSNGVVERCNKLLRMHWLPSPSIHS